MKNNQSNVCSIRIHENDREISTFFIIRDPNSDRTRFISRAGGKFEANREAKYNKSQKAPTGMKLKTALKAHRYSSITCNQSKATKKQKNDQMITQSKGG